MQLKPLFVALTLALTPAAHAENLSDVYRDAQAYDAQFAAARAAHQAGQEKAVQGPRRSAAQRQSGRQRAL
jgi:outer membrane protein